MGWGGEGFTFSKAHPQRRRGRPARSHPGTSARDARGAHRDAAPQTSRTRLQGARRGAQSWAAPSARRRRRLADVPSPERPVPASCPHHPAPPNPGPQRSAELGPDTTTTAPTSDPHSPAAAPPERRLGPPAVRLAGPPGPAGRGGGARARGRCGGGRGAPSLFKSRGPYTRASPALPAPLSLSQGLAVCLAAAAAAAPPRLAGDPRPAAAARGAGRASRTRLLVPPGPARSLG